MKTRNIIAVVAVLAAFPVIMGAGCGKKIVPGPYIERADKAVKAAKADPAAANYAEEYMKKADDALQQARTLAKSKEPLDLEKVPEKTMTAEIYSKIALEFGSSKKKAEEDISSAKEAESQVRIQMEALKMSLERAKKIVPKLKDQINSIIRDLDKMFKEEKPSGGEEEKGSN